MIASRTSSGRLESVTMADSASSGRALKVPMRPYLLLSVTRMLREALCATARLTATLFSDGVETPRRPKEEVEMKARSKLKRRIASAAGSPTQDWFSRSTCPPVW